LAKPATRSIVKTEAPAPAAGKSVAVRSIAAENTDLAQDKALLHQSLQLKNQALGAP